MTEGLDLARESETRRVDVAQQLVGERDVLLERRLDLLDLGVLAHQIHHADDLRLPRVERLGRRPAWILEEPARCGVHTCVEAGLEGRCVEHVERDADAIRLGLCRQNLELRGRIALRVEADEAE